MSYLADERMSSGLRVVMVSAMTDEMSIRTDGAGGAGAGPAGPLAPATDRP
jgi:hypothetical protein